jgi:hypothetical protein
MVESQQTSDVVFLAVGRCFVWAKSGRSGCRPRGLPFPTAANAMNAGGNNHRL